MAAVSVGAVLALVSGPVAASVDPPAHQGRASTLTPRTWVPSAAPADLGALITRLGDSVATVFCGTTPATAWAVEGIRLNPEATAQGHRTMLVTSLESVERCTYAGKRYIELRHRGVETMAYVWGWDEKTGLAAVHSTNVIPGLQWSGVPRPVLGQWVAAIGSSNGVGVSTTMGQVTEVGLRDLKTNLSVGAPGMGGPIVDSAGRVLATHISEGLDIQNRAVGSPLLCDGVINCARPLDVWMNFTVPGAVSLLRATPLKGAVRVTWARPTTTSTTSPVDTYEYRVGAGAWTATSSTAVTIGRLAKGRPVTVEVRAVNFMGPGVVATVSSRAR